MVAVKMQGGKTMPLQTRRSKVGTPNDLTETCGVGKLRIMDDYDKRLKTDPDNRDLSRIHKQ
jgi:hypothetical protein